MKEDHDSAYVQQYIKNFDVSGIIVLSSECNEGKSGYQEDSAYEQIACIKKDGTYCILTVEWFQKYLPSSKAGIRYDKKGERPISKEEYQNYLREFEEPLDTPDVHKGLSKNKDYEAKMDLLSPDCPLCKGKMQKRKGKFGEFWRCKKFPSCKGTINMSEKDKIEYKKLYEEYYNIQG